MFGQSRYRKALFRTPRTVDDEAEEAGSDDSDIADANIPPALQYVSVTHYIACLRDSSFIRHVVCYSQKVMRRARRKRVKRAIAVATAAAAAAAAGGVDIAPAVHGTDVIAAAPAAASAAPAAAASEVTIRTATVTSTIKSYVLHYALNCNDAASSSS